LDKLVYPDISPTMLTIAAVIICTLNLRSMAGKSGSQAGPDLACFPKDEEDIVDHFPVLSRSCDDISRRSASGSRTLHRQGMEDDRKPRPAVLRLCTMPPTFSSPPNAPSLTPTTVSWQRHSLLDGFWTSSERTFPSILPNAVSLLLKSACGPMHSDGDVEA
jgi:hypothetical protein